MLGVVRDLRSPSPWPIRPTPPTTKSTCWPSSSWPAWPTAWPTAPSAASWPRSRRSWPRPGCGPGSRAPPRRPVPGPRPARPSPRHPPRQGRRDRLLLPVPGAALRGELHELTGRLIGSPIDEVNRPRHSGDFTVRVPPSPAALNAFFAGWRTELATSRKWLTAARHYAMARLAAEVGLRLRELCALGLEDLHFDHGPLGKLHVRAGKGASAIEATPAAGAHAGGRPGAAGVVGHRGPRRVPRRLAAARGAAVPHRAGRCDRRGQLRGRAGRGRGPAPAVAR